MRCLRSNVIPVTKSVLPRPRPRSDDFEIASSFSQMREETVLRFRLDKMHYKTIRNTYVELGQPAF